VLSRLDYCNAVLAGFSSGNTVTVAESPERGSKTRILDLKPRDHVTSALRELHSLRTGQRSEYKLCLLVYKTCFGHASDSISNLLTPVADMPARSSLLASSNGNLFLPRMERRFGDRAFSVAAPGAFNRLPTELKRMFSSRITFQNHLKTFLLNSAYTPH